MSDKALQNAKTHKDQLVKERHGLNERLLELDREIGRVDQFISDWHAFAGGLAVISGENVSGETTNEPEQKDRTQKKTTGNSPKEEVADAAREIILERGAPIMRDELYGLLTERGLTIHGKDPMMVLSTMLWRMKDRVVRLKGGGYWPAGVANEEFRYDPQTFTSTDGTGGWLNKPMSEIFDPDSEEGKDAMEQAG